MERYYKAVRGAMFNDEEANVYGTELERIGRKEGRITVEVLIKKASAKSSPLHAAFEWDDTEAAKRWRKHQARQLMSHLVLVVERPDAEPREVKAYYSISEAPEDNGKERAYVHVELVLERRELRAQLIERAIREIEGWQQRHNDLVELELIFGAIKATKKKMEKEKGGVTAKHNGVYSTHE